MPALASITINDGAATPVAHVFAPVTTDGQLAELAERVGLPFAYPSLKVSVRPPVKNGQGMYRIKAQIVQPITKVVDGVTVLDYENRCDIELLVSERSSVQNRTDILAFCQNLSGNATFKSMVQNLEPLY